MAGEIASNTTVSSGVPLEISSPSWDALLDFFQNIVASTTWPLVTLVIALVYRKSILSALGKLKSLKIGDAEATFDREIKEVTESAKSLEPAPQNIAEINNQRILELIDMAAVSPTGAIVEAWKDIDKTAHVLAESSGLPLSSNKKRPYFNIQDFLDKNNLLPKAEIDTYRNLRMIRNRAAHSTDEEVTVQQARQYVRVADRLVDAMNTLKSVRTDNLHFAK